MQEPKRSDQFKLEVSSTAQLAQVRTETLYRVKRRISQDHLDPVFNKGQDVTLCESVHRTSTCFRCYPLNQ